LTANKNNYKSTAPIHLQSILAESV